MTLRQYIEKRKITMKAFCEKHEFSYSYFRVLSCGARTPSLDLAIKIERATKGKVKPQDFIVTK